jgi:hypothetical protein
VAITIVLMLHATHHGAHAHSPTHCGFWSDIEAWPIVPLDLSRVPTGKARNPLAVVAVSSGHLEITHGSPRLLILFGLGSYTFDAL